MARLSQALIANCQAGRLLAALEKQKSVLLSELAHRVANNFATIAAVIRQKSILVIDPQARSALEEAIEQVTVMARIHGHLCASNRAVFLDTQSFMQELCEDIRTSVESRRPISIECTAVSHSLPVVDAVPLGLIVNELITNAIKYAFPDCRAGIIRLSLDRCGGQLRLSVQDDGVGMQSSVQGTGVGHQLVQALAQQLGARVEIKSEGQGTVISITFDADKQLNFAAHNLEAGTIMSAGTSSSQLGAGFAQPSA